jgi:DNA polymerase-3 subunit epsilon
MLQNRVNEFKSAILNFAEKKVYVKGFTREEMLQRYLEKGTQCWSSQGMYDYQDLEFHNIKNDALIIVQKDGKEIDRYQYKHDYKDTVQYKDEEGKLISLTFTIRKSTYSDHYHMLTEKSSLLFENKAELDKYLLEEFNYFRSYEGGRQLDFITIDFEIANHEYSSACSLGLALVNNNEIIDKKHFYIQPATLYFNPDMVNIHGITAEHVKDAKKFNEIWDEIKEYFNDSNVFVAHNAQFDMSVLHACLKEYSLEMPDFTYIDSIPISSRACRGERVGNSLKERLDYFGIPLKDHHDALADAVSTAQLVIQCVKLENRSSLEAYCRTYWDIPKRSFSELKPNRSFRKRKKFNKINIKEIAATVETFDETHVFFGKTFVFTGELQSVDRNTAMQKIVDLGGVVKSGVSKKVNYLVVGKQDKSLVGANGLSTKEEKAYTLINQGVDIKILYEDEFLRMID